MWGHGISYFRIWSSLTHSQRLQAIALGCPFESRPIIYQVINVVYLRFENIRDAELTLKDKNVKPQEWQIEAVSAYEINKVSISHQPSRKSLADEFKR